VNFIIQIPNFFTDEIQYSLNVLLKYCLGIDNFSFSIGVDSDFSFLFAENKLVVKNHFFKSVPDSELYSVKNLPHSENMDITADIIPVYGENKVEMMDQSSIVLHADLVSSTFFLLTQWEHQINSFRDEHNRYILNESFIGKNKIYHRPLVNEYAEFLYQNLTSLGFSLKRKEWYKSTMTIDVDQLYKWQNFNNLLGSLKRNLTSPVELLDQIKSYFQSKKIKQKDKYFTIPFMIETANKNDIESIVFLKTGISNPQFDRNRYDIFKERRLIKELEENQTLIGIHPSYESSLSKETIEHEVRLLSQATHYQITYSRQHFLRYNRDTFRFLEACGIRHDSSIQYTEGMGFANGICTVYPIFDIEQKRILDLFEIPLLIMKKESQGISSKTFLQKSEELILEARKHNAEFMVLFHNTDVETRKGKLLFENILQLMAA